MGSDSDLHLPPGFQFYPTDEELIAHFLHRRASSLPCNPDVIPDLDMELVDPWEVQDKALAGNNQWYFFSHPSRSHSSPSGYWKPISSDEIISCRSKTVGVKKSMSFYFGEAPAGTKTSWLMHEYCLLEYCRTTRSRSIRSSERRTSRNYPAVSNEEWVLCRVFDGDGGRHGSFHEEGTELSCLDEVFLSLDDLDEVSMPNSSNFCKKKEQER